MFIYGNLFMHFILFELPIYSPLTGSFHSTPHSYHIPINATKFHHFTTLIIQHYCQTTHLPPDHTIHFNPCPHTPACAMGITASMPTAYHYNHCWLVTPIPIPTHSTLTSHITTLLRLLDWTQETSWSLHSLATIYPATKSIPEDWNHQEMIWYKWSHKVSNFKYTYN